MVDTVLLEHVNADAVRTLSCVPPQWFGFPGSMEPGGLPQHPSMIELCSRVRWGRLRRGARTGF